MGEYALDDYYEEPDYDEPSPRLCRDIFDSNADTFIADIDKKIAKIKSARASTKEGGDYNHTLTAYISVLSAARNAAVSERNRAIELNN